MPLNSYASSCTSAQRFAQNLNLSLQNFTLASTTAATFINAANPNVETKHAQSQPTTARTEKKVQFHADQRTKEKNNLPSHLEHNSAKAYTSRAFPITYDELCALLTETTLIVSRDYDEDDDDLYEHDNDALDEKYYCLNASHRCIRDEGALLIAKLVRGIPSVTSLNIRANGFTPAGTALLVEALRGSNVRSLDLSGCAGFPLNFMGKEGTAALHEHLLNEDCKLQRLYCGSMGSIGMGEFVRQKIVMHNQSLQILDLNGNLLGNDLCIKLCEVLWTTQISSLSLVRNGLSESRGCGEALATLIQELPSLRLLNLSNNKFSAQFLNFIKPSLTTVHCKLRVLKLDENGKIGNSVGPTHIGDIIKSNTSLRYLSLDRCNFNELTGLADALSTNQTLTQLRLSGNGIETSAARQLMNAIIRNTSLTKINLSENCLDDNYADHLSQFLISNVHFQHLNLSLNHLTDGFAMKLIQATYEYPTCTLAHLILTKNRISRFMLAKLDQTMTRNSRLHRQQLISEYKQSIADLRKTPQRLQGCRDEILKNKQIYDDEVFQALQLESQLTAHKQQIQQELQRLKEELASLKQLRLQKNEEFKERENRRLEKWNLKEAHLTNAMVAERDEIGKEKRNVEASQRVYSRVERSWESAADMRKSSDSILNQLNELLKEEELACGQAHDLMITSASALTLFVGSILADYWQSMIKYYHRSLDTPRAHDLLQIDDNHEYDLNLNVFLKSALRYPSPLNIISMIPDAVSKRLPILQYAQAILMQYSNHQNEAIYSVRTKCSILDDHGGSDQPLLPASIPLEILNLFALKEISPIPFIGSTMVLHTVSPLQATPVNHGSGITSPRNNTTSLLSFENGGISFALLTGEEQPIPMILTTNQAFTTEIPKLLSVVSHPDLVCRISWIPGLHLEDPIESYLSKIPIISPLTLEEAMAELASSDVKVPAVKSKNIVAKSSRKISSPEDADADGILEDDTLGLHEVRSRNSNAKEAAVKADPFAFIDELDLGEVGAEEASMPGQHPEASDSKDFRSQYLNQNEEDPHDSASTTPAHKAKKMKSTSKIAKGKEATGKKLEAKKPTHNRPSKPKYASSPVVQAQRLSPTRPTKVAAAASKTRNKQELPNDTSKSNGLGTKPARETDGKASSIVADAENPRVSSSSPGTPIPSFMRGESMDSAQMETFLQQESSKSTSGTGVPVYLSSTLHSRESLKSRNTAATPIAAKRGLVRTASQYASVKDFTKSGRVVMTPWQLTFGCVQPTLEDMDFSEALKEASEWRHQKDLHSQSADMIEVSSIIVRGGQDENVSPNSEGNNFLSAEAQFGNEASLSTEISQLSSSTVLDPMSISNITPNLSALMSRIRPWQQLVSAP